MKAEQVIAMDLARKARESMEAAQNAYRKRKDALLVFAPVKIGDTIPVTGYAHRGKKMVVERLIIKESSGFRGSVPVLTFKASGPVLNKDGTPSAANVGECEWDMEGKPTR